MFAPAKVYAIILAPALFALSVVGQTTHTVTTGQEGSFFDPPTLSVQINDTVIFIFSGNAHTVTQSTFENPCIALPGGFNSGVAGTNNTALPTPRWNLQITNVTAPIWYFCQISRPQSHCAAGMVGVINPPNISMFNQFQAAAKAVSGTPAPTITLALTGQGAFATASPTAGPAPSTLSSSTITSTPMTSSTAPAATSQPSSSKNTGVIVGAAVGGGIGSIILIFLLAICWRTYYGGNSPLARRDPLPPPVVTQEVDRYRYRERPYTGITSSDTEAMDPNKSLNTVRHLASDGNISTFSGPTAPNTPMRPFDNENATPLVPVRRPLPIPGGQASSRGRASSGAQTALGFGQQNGSANAIDTSRNIDSSDIASTSSRSDQGPATGLVDIHSLAQEVAAVLRSGSALGSNPNLKGQSEMIIHNNDDSQTRLANAGGDRGNEREDASRARDNITTESPPPHYTIGGGGQRRW